MCKGPHFWKAVQRTMVPHMILPQKDRNNKKIGYLAQHYFYSVAKVCKIDAKVHKRPQSNIVPIK